MSDLGKAMDEAGFLKCYGFYEVRTVAGGSVCIEPTMELGVFELAVYDREQQLLMRRKLHITIVRSCP